MDISGLEVDQPERAARLLGAADEARRSIGSQPVGFAQAAREISLAAAREQLGDEDFGRAMGEGAAMTLEEVVEYAVPLEVSAI